MQYFAVNKSNRGKASWTGHEGKEVIGSMQYSAVNEPHRAKASMRVHEGKEVIGSV